MTSKFTRPYIEASDMFGMPLRVRIGRQEIAMGKKWLVGDRIFPTRGLSHDGVRITYSPDNFTVDAWWAKLTDTSPMEEDGDVDFYGIYATYSGFEPLSVSASTGSSSATRAHGTKLS